MLSFWHSRPGLSVERKGRSNGPSRGTKERHPVDLGVEPAGLEMVPHPGKWLRILVLGRGDIPRRYVSPRPLSPLAEVAISSQRMSIHFGNTHVHASGKSGSRVDQRPGLSWASVIRGLSDPAVEVVLDSCWAPFLPWEPELAPMRALHAHDTWVCPTGKRLSNGHGLASWNLATSQALVPKRIG